MHQYAIGQRWSYKTRPEDIDSTIVIGAVQVDPPTIHISVEALTAPNSPKPLNISHMPFSQEAIDESVLELLETDFAISPGFQEGYDDWVADNGGVFMGSISEAISAIFTNPSAAETDIFDRLVLEMRAEQSAELISELYQQVFSLHTWFFLCTPGEEQAPVQWQFSVGENTSPAVIAFTSREKAVTAADKLSIYEKGAYIQMIPAGIDEAVNWLASDQCQSTWVCFNLTHQNFPLYVNDAVRMLEKLSAKNDS